MKNYAFGLVLGILGFSFSAEAIDDFTPYWNCEVTLHQAMNRQDIKMSTYMGPAAPGTMFDQNFLAIRGMLGGKAGIFLYQTNGDNAWNTFKRFFVPTPEHGANFRISVPDYAPGVGVVLDRDQTGLKLMSPSDLGSPTPDQSRRVPYMKIAARPIQGEEAATADYLVTMKLEKAIRELPKAHAECGTNEPSYIDPCRRVHTALEYCSKPESSTLRSSVEIVRHEYAAPGKTSERKYTDFQTKKILDRAPALDKPKSINAPPAQP